MPPPVSDAISIRPARPDEYQAVGELTVAAYDADGHLIRSDGEPDTYYAGWLRDAAPRGAGGGLLVAADHSGLLGTVTWCPPGSPFREVATDERQGEFRTLSVAPGARGRGIGQALVAACIDRARDLGLTEVVLCSLPEMVPAHRLYASFGFARRPDLDWSPFDGVTLWGFWMPLQRAGSLGSGG
ncbi:MAG: GNAT family N-acetyltransferase [Aeromicrobium sp.]|uniref:GNAT family N-acetyltransferase n=1 Tax=Aeromicrobium sp. TaxID=1871063 RepID=UPI003C677561